MFSYNKFLEFPVKVSKPNPRLANVVITQYGGPNGELGASLRVAYGYRYGGIGTLRLSII